VPLLPLRHNTVAGYSRWRFGHPDLAWPLDWGQMGTKVFQLGLGSSSALQILDVVVVDRRVCGFST
jgi:hypothetical protein